MGLLRIAQAPVVTVNPQTTVSEAVRTMDKEGIGLAGKILLKNLLIYLPWSQVI